VSLIIDTDQSLSIPPKGARLAYGLAGEAGPPVLLLMGFAMPGRAWVHQVPTLSARHRVAFYDHRGAGRTRAPVGTYSMDLLAADAAALLDHLGWADAHVVGVSMGGMVAQHFALAHPERVRSLTLIVTHPGGLAYRAPTLAGMARFAQVNLARTAEARLDALERLLFPAAFLRSCDRAWIREVLRRDFDQAVTPAQRFSQLAAVARHDTRARLAALGRHRTLVVKAGKDILIRTAGSDALHRGIPGSRRLDFPDAGHGIIRQCHGELNSALLAHFAESDGAPRTAEL
jgi:pimeloyl-ACP methyl ester carboxylesterase